MWGHKLEGITAGPQAATQLTGMCIVLQVVEAVVGGVDRRELEGINKVMSYMRVSGTKPGKKVKKRDRARPMGPDDVAELRSTGSDTPRSQAAVQGLSGCWSVACTGRKLHLVKGVVSGVAASAVA